MDVNKMTIEQFLRLPHSNWQTEVECDSIIILPSKINDFDVVKYYLQKAVSSIFSFIKKPETWGIKGLHDSGYRCMSFVAVKKNVPFCIISGCSDVIHLDGISGLRKNWYEKYGKCPETIPPSAWNMDCLPMSGLLRLWPSSGKMLCGIALSSFEVFAMPKEKK